MLRADNETLTFAYDATTGRLNAMTLPAGTPNEGAYGYAYHPGTGLLNGITTPAGDQLSLTFDGFLLTQETSTGQVPGTLAYGYNSDFRLTSLSVNGDAISYAYDNDGLLTAAGDETLSRDQGTGFLAGTLLDNISSAHTYNGFGELATETYSYNGTPIYEVSYVHDALGRITQKTESVSGTSHTYDYRYDTKGFLDQVERDSVIVESYGYNVNGGRIYANGVSATFDMQDRMTAFGSRVYTYGRQGELTGRTDGLDVRTYAYDLLGNLISADISGVAIDYVVDGRNRRVGKKVGGTLVQGFLYQDQLEPVAELDGSGQIVSRFVYGSKGHVPDYMIKGGQTYRLITDQVGSVRLVVNASDGSIAQQLDYNSAGVVTADSNPGFQPFGFAGGLYDRDTQLVRFGARDYDPEAGRWTAKDPLGFGGGDTNVYAYVGGNPVSFIDPLGLWSFTAGGYFGPGVEVTFGNDSGNRFMTLRIGLGIGLGASYDPNGGLPGSEPDNRCQSGQVLSASGQANFNAGPLGAGLELGAARNYRDQQSSIYGGPSFGLTSERWGLGGSASIGGQATVYNPNYYGGDH